jgi:hypothetical protein
MSLVIAIFPISLFSFVKKTAEAAGHPRFFCDFIIHSGC